MAAAATPEAATADEEAPFEAFATCDFATASRLALAELASTTSTSTTSTDRASPAVAAGGAGAAVPLALPGASKCSVALTEACSRYDKLAAVALQCGLELRRDEEARAVAAYYLQRTHGRVPFPVAVIWLQILLAQGGQARVEESKGVLVALRQAIEGVWTALPPRMEGVADEQEEEEDGSTEGSGSGASANSSPTAAQAQPPEAAEEHELLSMYAQATELLVLRVLLPRGEGPAAMELLQPKPQPPQQEGEEEGGNGNGSPLLLLLEAGHRQRLLEACRSDARRRAALGSSGGVQQSKGGKRRPGAGAAGAAANGRSYQQRRPPSAPPQQQTTTTTLLSSGRLSPSAVAAARARSPSPGWGSGVLGLLFGGGGELQRQGQQQGRTRRWVLAVIGFAVLALGYAARRGRGDGPLRIVRAALAAVLGGAAGRRALS